MSARSDIVTQAVATELILTEKITEMLEGNYPVRVADVIANVYDINEGEAATLQVPLAPVTTITSGSTITEGEDTMTLTAYDPTSDTISVSMKGIWRGLTEQALFHATQDLKGSALEDSVLAILDQRDRLLLAEALNATNTADFSGQAFNLDNFGSAIATFKALNPRPGSNGFAIVLQTDQMKDLLEDIRSTTGVAFAGAAFEMNDMFSGMAGYHGVLEGYNVFESPSVIATDANNWSGFICGAGDRGSLGLAISRIGGSDLIVRMSEPGSSAHTKLQHEIFVGSEYGVGILQDNNFLEVVSKT